MRSDCASVPTRGSRFVGLDSMIMTRVLGSGRCVQERSPSTATAMIAGPANDQRPTTNDNRPVAERRRLRIRYLAQDGRLPGAGSRRKIRRLAMPRLVSEHREGDGFFGLGRKSEL